MRGERRGPLSEESKVERKGRFEVLRRIGSGGFGIVYEVVDRERDAHVALKTLARLDPSALYRFKREFRALADVRHKNLVELYELVAEADEWFFTMELVDGVDCLAYVRHRRALDRLALKDADTLDVEKLEAPLGLANTADARVGRTPRSTPRTPRTPSTPRRGDGSRLVRIEGRAAEVDAGRIALDEERLRAMLVQLVEGVRALHAAGKLHRDIKPSNVLVAGDGRVVLVDFGIATELRERTEPRSDGNQIAGTPEYMAPEQATAGALGPAADWYAVGTILYEALTGRLPFAGSPLEILLDKQRSEPPSPRALFPDIAPDLDALCVDLLRTTAAARPTGDEILQRLARRRVGRPSRAPSSPPPSAPPSSVAVSGHFVAGSPITKVPGDPKSALIGRDAELSMLRAAHDSARGGRAVTVLVHGRSGMGKSALVQSFLEELRGGTVVLSGRCYERESVPYKALDSVIDELSRFLLQLPAKDGAAVVPRDAGALVRLFPVLQRVSSIAEAPRRPAHGSVDVHKLRQRAFGALRELFGRLCDRHSVVVFIDDLQWGDADSAALLSELMAPPDAPSLLLILGYRSEDAETSAPIRALSHPPRAGLPIIERRTIAVGPLSLDDGEELARTLLGDANAEDDEGSLSQDVALESAGNPLFVHELVRYVQEDPDALRAGGLRLEKLLQKRLVTLPADARRLLDVVAVAGRPIRIELAARAAGLARDACTRAVELLRLRNLVRTAGTRATDVLEPYHDRIREAGLSLLGEDELAEGHGALARVLRAAGETDPEMLFMHFAAAARPSSPQEGALIEAAIHYAEEAAKKSALALAFDRAAQFHRHALDRLPPNDPRAHALRIALGDALSNIGRGTDAADAYLAAAEQSAVVGERLDLRRRAAEQLIVSGHIDLGVSTIESVLVQVGLRLPKTPLGALVSLLFMRMWLSIRGLRFRERDALRISPIELTRIDVSWSLAAGLSVVDNVRAANFQTRNLLACLRAGEPSRLGRALALEAIFVSLAGEAAASRGDRIVQLAQDLARRAPQPDSEALIALSLAAICYFTGRFRKAFGHSEHFLEIYRDGLTSTRWELRATQYYGLCSLIHCGELELLRDRLPAYLREANDRGDLFLSTNLGVGYTNLFWLLEDDPQTAASIVDEGMARWSHRTFQVQHWYALHSRAQIALYRGQGKQALHEVESQLGALRSSLLLRVQYTRLCVGWLRARCAIAAGEIAIARNEARKMMRERAVWATPLARMVHASVAAHDGDVDEAIASLRLAASELDIEGMSLYAAIARVRLGELLGRSAASEEEGRMVADEGNSWLRAKGVVRPDCIVETLAPGFRLS